MKRITNTERRDFVKGKLSTSETWAKAALIKIFDFQTETEKNVEATTDHNGVGFTGADGEILTSFAKQYLHKKYLSAKQMALLFKKIPKYWKQIVKISDEEKLNALIVNNR